MALLPKKDTPLVPKAEDLRLALEDSNKQAQDYKDKSEQPTWQYEDQSDSASIGAVNAHYLNNGGAFTTATAYLMAVNVEAGREYTVDFNAGGLITRVAGTPASSSEKTVITLYMLQGSTTTTLRQVKCGMALNNGAWNFPVHLHAVVTPKASQPAHFAVTCEMDTTNTNFKFYAYHGLTVTPRLAKVGRDTKR